MEPKADPQVKQENLPQPPPLSEFGRLRLAVDVILASPGARRIKDACVNWADLRCVNVLWGLDETYTAFWLVSIEEASPDNAELSNYITQKLAAKGYNLYVEFNW